MSRSTALHGAHVALGAKMGEFAGYDMPLYYGLGVKKEHEWVRSSAGLFDVSHLGQISVKGGEGKTDAVEFFEKITPSAFSKLGIDRTKYTVLTNEQGGIIDDLMVTKTGDNEFHCVINAGCKEKDIEWIKSHLPDSLEFKYYDDWALIAIQGPKPESVVRDVLGVDLSGLRYMGLWAQDDYQMFVSRLGYTGEDGFEILVPAEFAEALAEHFLADERVKLIGLGARDSLRLEAGLCLYGHDIDADTTPVEGSLLWLISKSRRVSGDFPGSAKILDQLANGVSRKRVGIKPLGRAPAREGTEIRSAEGEAIGAITSGGFGPTVEGPVAMGYVKSGHTKVGTPVKLIVRGKELDAEVAALPFVPHKYKR